MKTDSNKKPASKPVNEVRDATAKLDAWRRKVTFLLPLSPAEQREHRASKIGAKALRTLENRLVAAKENPALLPSAFDLAKFEQDAALTSALADCVTALDGIRAEVHDTFLAVANRAVVAGATVYSHIKVASATAERLKRTVDKLASRTSTTAATGEPTEPAAESAPVPKPAEAASPVTPSIPPADKAA